MIKKGMSGLGIILIIIALIAIGFVVAGFVVGWDKIIPGFSWGGQNGNPENGGDEENGGINIDTTKTCGALGGQILSTQCSELGREDLSSQASDPSVVDGSSYCCKKE